MSENERPDGNVRDPIAIMEALLDDVAEQAAEDYIPNEDDRRWARGLGATVEQRLASLGRRPPPPLTARLDGDIVIPEELRTLDRASLLLRLEILRRTPNVQYAHQRLTRLSDDSLRRLLAVLMLSQKGDLP
jgi:hypothetical protein